MLPEESSRLKNGQECYIKCFILINSFQLDWESKATIMVWFKNRKGRNKIASIYLNLTGHQGLIMWPKSMNFPCVSNWIPVFCQFKGYCSQLCIYFTSYLKNIFAKKFIVFMSHFSKQLWKRSTSMCRCDYMLPILAKRLLSLLQFVYIKHIIML